MGPDELAAVGLSPPNAMFSVFGGTDDGEDAAEVFATVHIGMVRGEEGIVARTAGSDVVYLLDYELAEHIPLSLEAFRNRFQSEETPEEVAPSDDPPTDASDSEPDASN